MAIAEARIEKLESTVGRLRIVLVVVPLLAFVLGAAANDALTAKSVTTERLQIVNPAGETRASLFTNAKGDPVLELYNADGSLLVNAGRSPDNGVGFIQFFDEQGQFKGGAGGNALK